MTNEDIKETSTQAPIETASTKDEATTGSPAPSRRKRGSNVERPFPQVTFEVAFAF